MIVDDVDYRKIVTKADFIVIDIVSRSHFQTAGTEADLDIRVLDDRYFFVYQWNEDFLPFKPMIALVVRVDADRSIRHDGLRTCGCDNYIFVRAVSVTVRDIVSEVIEMALGLLVNNFLVADCGMSFRIPVYHTHSPVNQSFFIEIYESVDDGFRQIRIHGEFGTVPVTGCSEFAELAEDNAAMLFFPFPSIFEELFSGEVFLVDSLRLEP